MAEEFSDSNHSSLNNDITYPNPTLSESAFTSSWGSYSSFFTTSFESNIDSNETDNEDCDDNSIAELTRQMADYMLQEDDNDHDMPLEAFSSRKTISQNQNQHQVRGNSNHGKRGKMNDQSAQMMKPSREERVSHVDYGPGSGMRAIFLKGPGSKNEPNGTGVFLPHSATDPKTHSRKKPGYSTALVPTRVLQALEHHFKNTGSLSPSSNLLQVQRTSQGQRSSCDMQRKKVRLRSTSTDHVEKKLPQEWTY